MKWIHSILIILFTSNISADIVITMKSETGDYVGQGLDYNFTESSGSFDSAIFQDRIIFINYDDLTQNRFSFDFVPPNNQDLARGAFLNAQRYPFQGPLNPGISITGNGRGCNQITGYFIIYEYDLSAVEPIVALDFVQYCDNSVGALTGSIRVNSSIPIPYNLPFAIPTVSKSKIIENEVVVLDGSQSLGGDSEIVSYSWTQSSGTDVIFDNQNIASPTIQVPNRVSLGGDALEFTLTVTNASGQQDSSTVDVYVNSKSDPRSFFTMDSETGDYIGQGQQWSYTDESSVITAQRNFDNGVSVVIDGTEFWFADFAAPNDTRLEEGEYLNATRYPFQEPDVPGLSISGDGRGCNQNFGSFIVDSVVWENNEPTRFSATFEQYCESLTRPALRGEVAVNALHPSVPTANAGEDSSYPEGTLITLNGSNSFDSDGSIISYTWSTEATGIELTDNNTSRPNFTAPTLNNREASRQLTFELLIEDDLGYLASDSVVINVTENNSSPNAASDEVTIDIGETVVIRPIDNDSDSDGEISIDSISVVSQPSQGDVVVSSDGEVTYTHTGTTSGSDSFSYTVTDNDGAVSNQAVVTITINNASAPAPTPTPQPSSSGGGGSSDQIILVMILLLIFRKYLVRAI